MLCLLQKQVMKYELLDFRQNVNQAFDDVTSVMLAVEAGIHKVEHAALAILTHMLNRGYTVAVNTIGDVCRNFLE